MNRKIITLTIAATLSLGGNSLQAHGPGHGHHPGGHLDKLTEPLNLTADQKAKAQPILDQARPQVEAIHHEAMEKMKAVMENTSAQLWPLLTPDQQQKLDAMRKAHENMRDAMRELHEAKKK